MGAMRCPPPLLALLATLVLRWRGVPAKDMEPALQRYVIEHAHGAECMTMLNKLNENVESYKEEDATLNTLIGKIASAAQKTFPSKDSENNMAGLSEKLLQLLEVSEGPPSGAAICTV